MNLARLKINSIHNVLGWAIPVIIFLFITPIMVKKLGVEAFGVVTLIQIITGYMTILNFGFSDAIIKQVAESLNRDKNHTLKVMWAGLGLFFAIGLIGALVLFMLSEWLGMHVFLLPDSLRADTVLAIKIGSVVFLLQMIAEFYRGSAIGCNRFAIPSISRIIRISISALLIVYALENGGGVSAVMLATLVGLFIGLILNIIWMQRVLPMHWVSGGYRDILWEMFHFSKHIFVARLAGLFSRKISQLLLGTISSVANVALYEVPTRAADAGSSILGRALQVFYPAVSSMDKVNEKDRIQRLLFSVLSIQLLISTPLMIMIMLEGSSVLAVWIDPEFAVKSAGIINLIAISYFLSSLTNLPSFAAMSFNYPGIISKYSILALLITTTTVYPLVSHYGLIGAAWVLFLSGLPGIPFIYETIHRIFGVNIYAEFFRKLSIHALIGGIIYTGYNYGYRNTDWYTPLGALSIGLLYPLLAISLKATSREDNRRLIKLFTVWR